jgi:membrane protein DedA with SNARE-associated domain
MLPVPAQLGYPALFGLIFAESAGVPVPGETALLAAGVLAGTGHLTLPVVIAVAVAAAVLGDTLGYWLGRRGGRTVLLRHGPFKAARAQALERGERFFARHGPKTVFLGRFVPGVRVFAAVMAGASAMAWPRFALYNVAGAFVWATTVAGLAALLGPTASSAFAVVAITIGVVGAGALLWRARRRRPRGAASLAPDAVR